jgi:hypothetical protein
VDLIRRILGNWLFLDSLSPPAPGGSIRSLEAQPALSSQDNNRARETAIETAREIFEAESSRGAGPYMGPVRMAEAQRLVTERLRENFAELERGDGRSRLAADEQHALYGFSRYGIQRIIAASRLCFIKNPLVRRGVMLDGATTSSAAASRFGLSTKPRTPLSGVPRAQRR